jgi:hypothetical protein
MALSSLTLRASAADIFCPGIPFGCSASRTGLGGFRTPGIGRSRALVIVAQLGAQCCARARPVSFSKAERHKNTSKHRPRFLSQGFAIRSDLATGVRLISFGLFAAVAGSSPPRPVGAPVITLVHPPPSAAITRLEGAVESGPSLAAGIAGADPPVPQGAPAGPPPGGPPGPISYSVCSLILCGLPHTRLVVRYDGQRCAFPQTESSWQVGPAGL